MKRGEFLRFAGGVAGWPLAARAQQRVPVIGYLGSQPNSNTLASLREGLGTTGYVEGRISRLISARLSNTTSCPPLQPNSSAKTWT
jgi:hypothetical protein